MFMVINTVFLASFILTYQEEKIPVKKKKETPLEYKDEFCKIMKNLHSLMLFEVVFFPAQHGVR